jgi:hypothetical protein
MTTEEQQKVFDLMNFMNEELKRYLLSGNTGINSTDIIHACMNLARHYIDSVGTDPAIVFRHMADQLDGDKISEMFNGIKLEWDN